MQGMWLQPCSKVVHIHATFVSLQQRVDDLTHRGVILSDDDRPPTLSTRVLLELQLGPSAAVCTAAAVTEEVVQGDVDALSWRCVDQPRTWRQTDPRLQCRYAWQESRVRRQRLTSVQWTDLRWSRLYYRHIRNCLRGFIYFPDLQVARYSRLSLFCSSLLLISSDIAFINNI